MGCETAEKPLGLAAVIHFFQSASVPFWPLLGTLDNPGIVSPVDNLLQYRSEQNVCV
jgi:hypothetical protein